LTQRLILVLLLVNPNPNMANNLPIEKQIIAISALAEGSSIRSIERMTGIHRDTIMRLGIRIGEACQTLMHESMRGLPCKQIQVDEIWGYIGKKALAWVTFGPTLRLIPSRRPFLPSWSASGTASTPAALPMILLPVWPTESSFPATE
jgi:hypothetical protein